ncbi:LexA family transcriptional regulator [Chitinilyticum litopenaei]|uniref:LexA family transcriptional regulator n=1 Tax=Chitinilyticum piscinae TaxID=2866724 RepID=A0A8J7FKQ2_9NEIS|nr:LexA family transcriptional regulator [Chitinilyticum piscinae]
MDTRTRLQQWMRHHGLTQGQLGQQAGVPQPTIQRILSGDTASPRTETLRKLISALGLTPAEFEAGPAVSAATASNMPLVVHAPLISGVVDSKPHFAATGVAVDRAILNMASVSANQLMAAMAPHNSMAPTIGKGDIVLIDTSRTELLSGQIFAVLLDDAIVIRRVVLGAEFISLQPDNQDQSSYFPIQLPVNASLQVIGHIFWRGGMLAETSVNIQGM